MRAEENIKKIEETFDEVVWNDTGAQLSKEALIEKVKDVDAIITCWGSNQIDKEVLDNAIALLEQMTSEGLFNALEKGIFGDVKRSRVGGKGLDGVVDKGANYMNPFINLMKGRK